MAFPGIPELLLIAAVAFGVFFFFVLLVALLFALRGRNLPGRAAQLRPCPDCRNRCSPRAAACPKCGCPLEPTSSQ